MPVHILAGNVITATERLVVHMYWQQKQPLELSTSW